MRVQRRLMETLDLVRLGVRPPRYDKVENSLPELDAVDAVTTPGGDVYWHRYNHDSYGESQDDGTVALTSRQTSSLSPCSQSRVGAEGQFGDQIEPDPAVCGPMIAEKAGMYAMVSRRKRRKPARLHNPPHAFNMSRVDEQIDITTRGRAEIGRSAQQAPAHTRLLESEKHGFQHRVQHRLAFHVRQPHNRLIKNRGEAA